MKRTRKARLLFIPTFTTRADSDAAIRLLFDPFQIGLNFWIVFEAVKVRVFGGQHSIGEKGVQRLVTGRAQFNSFRAAFGARDDVVARCLCDKSIT